MNAPSHDPPNPSDAAKAELARVRELYIEMVKLSVGDFIYDFDSARGHLQPPYTFVDTRTGRKQTFSEYADLKYQGLIGAGYSHTLIGMLRLNQLQQAVETVLREDIPGDLIETGVLRGGACIFMRAILKAYGVSDRKVWVADSFQGFPPFEPGPGRLDYTGYNMSAVPRPVVEENFKRYHLLDQQVEFLAGWFSDTLPSAPIEKLAILRLDGDIYPSTMDALRNLYPKLSPGGYVIVDDYYAFEECRQAVRDYRAAQGIKTPIQRVDGPCIFWRKQES